MVLVNSSAQTEIKIVKLDFNYSNNFEKMELQSVKALYGYVDLNATPGNGVLLITSDSGETLYSMRVGLIISPILINPPEIDVDTNETAGETEEMPEEGYATVHVPYYENMSTVKIILDQNGKLFEFPVKARLCDADGQCDKEESAISCEIDCPAD